MTLKLVTPSCNPAEPQISSSRDANGAVIVRIEPGQVSAPDALVPLTESGLEERAWRALVRSGELQARKLGRRWYTTQAALVALVLQAPKAAPAVAPDDAYAALLGRKKPAVAR